MALNTTQSKRRRLLPRSPVILIFEKNDICFLKHRNIKGALLCDVTMYKCQLCIKKTQKALCLSKSTLQFRVQHNDEIEKYVSLINVTHWHCTFICQVENKCASFRKPAVFEVSNFCFSFIILGRCFRLQNNA